MSAKKSDEKIFCCICKEFTKYSNVKTSNFTNHHLQQIHNMTQKEYYDSYLKKDNEDVCTHCGRNKTFLSLTRGYINFCIDHKCNNKNEAVIENRRKTCLLRYGDGNYRNSESSKEAWKKKTKNEIQEKINKTKVTCKLKYDDENYNNKEKKRETCLKIYGDASYTNRKKARETFRDRYGVDYPLLNEEILLKTQETMLKKYNVKFGLQSKEIWMKTFKSSGREIDVETLSAKQRYYREVHRETRKHIKMVFENWDGLDYYTGEKLILNDEFREMHPGKEVNSNPLQPTIEHKTSIHYGFENKIDSKDVGFINNLVICARLTNSMKNVLCEDEFKNILEEK